MQQKIHLKKVKVDEYRTVSACACVCACVYPMYNAYATSIYNNYVEHEIALEKSKIQPEFWFHEMMN